jgi:hypothetical protein
LSAHSQRDLVGAVDTLAGGVVALSGVSKSAIAAITLSATTIYNRLDVYGWAYPGVSGIRCKSSIISRSAGRRLSHGLAKNAIKPGKPVALSTPGTATKTAEQVGQPASAPTASQAWVPSPTALGSKHYSIVSSVNVLGQRQPE